MTRSNPKKKSGKGQSHVVKKPQAVLDLTKDVPEETRRSLMWVKGAVQIGMLAVLLGGLTVFFRYGLTPLAAEIFGTDTSVKFDVPLTISFTGNIALLLLFGVREYSRKGLRDELNSFEGRRGVRSRRRGR